MFPFCIVGALRRCSLWKKRFRCPQQLSGVPDKSMETICADYAILPV